MKKKINVGGKIYTKDITRISVCLKDIRAWYLGESDELKKWIGFGFYNTIFVVENNNVVVYYDKEECKEFEKVLDEKLDESLFDSLCDDFFKLINESEKGEGKENLFNISVKCWPALNIFDVISRYPEYATETMLTRLMRVRKTTESFHYELAKKIGSDDNLGDYIFYGGQIIEKPFEEWIEEMAVDSRI